MDINIGSMNALTARINLAFNKYIPTVDSHYDKVSMVVPSSAGENVYPRIAELPGMREWIGQRVMHRISAQERFTIANRTYEQAFSIRREDLEDDQYGFLTPAIGARVRFEWNEYVEANYARAKLADDGSPLSNQDGVVTPKTLKASWISQCKLYELQGWIDDVSTTGPQAVFERDVTDRNRVNTSLVIKPMGSLMVLANILKMEV